MYVGYSDGAVNIYRDPNLVIIVHADGLAPSDMH